MKYPMEHRIKQPATLLPYRRAEATNIAATIKAERKRLAALPPVKPYKIALLRKVAAK